MNTKRLLLLSFLCILFFDTQFQAYAYDGQPDLIVSSIEVTSYTETMINYSYVIKNIGTSGANMDGPTSESMDNVSIQTFLSVDTIFNNGNDIASGGTAVSMSSIGELAPGDSIEGSYGSAVAGGVNPSETPYLVIKVDWGGVVEESDESNNTSYTVIPVEDGQPDLIVSSIEVTSYTETMINYSYVIKNIGTSGANMDGPTSESMDNVSIQTFLSFDTIFNNGNDIASGGTVVSMSSIGELAPGDSVEGSYSSLVTGGVNPSETPYLVIKVDWGGAVEESDESNNTSYYFLNIISNAVLNKTELNCKIYPNPSDGIFNIRFDQNMTEKSLIQVRTSSGQSIKNIELSSNVKEYNHKINLSDLSNGIYFLSITNCKNSQINQKILIK